MNLYSSNTIIKEKLNALHLDAQKDYLHIAKGMAKSVFRPIEPKDFEQAYLPISKEQGRTLQQLVIENKCKNIIEFGTSFGISTIYLADAARQTGGKVISTELIKSKAQRAIQNIADAGLSDFAAVKIGDAMKTLAAHTEPIDFLFLDGWKDLYLPLFQLLEPFFHAGTIIYADNMDMKGTAPYANYVLGKQQVYFTKTVADGKAFLTAVL